VTTLRTYYWGVHILVVLRLMSMSASSASGPSSSPSHQVIHCTEELHQTLRALTRKRKKKPTLNSYSQASSKQSVPQRQHTQYCVYNDGSITYARRYIEPPKNAEPSQPLAREPSPAFIPDPLNDFSTYGLSDVDITPSLDDRLPQKRRRTAGVSLTVR
jgi:hypothetical protein